MRAESRADRYRRRARRVWCVHCTLLLLIAPGLLAGAAGRAQATVSPGTAHANAPLSGRHGEVRRQRCGRASKVSSAPGRGADGINLADGDRTTRDPTTKGAPPLQVQAPRALVLGNECVQPTDPTRHSIPGERCESDFGLGERWSARLRPIFRLQPSTSRTPTLRPSLCARTIRAVMRPPSRFRSREGQRHRAS